MMEFRREPTRKLIHFWCATCLRKMSWDEIPHFLIWFAPNELVAFDRALRRHPICSDCYDTYKTMGIGQDTSEGLVVNYPHLVSQGYDLSQYTYAVLGQICLRGFYANLSARRSGGTDLYVRSSATYPELDYALDDRDMFNYLRLSTTSDWRDPTIFISPDILSGCYETLRVMSTAVNWSQIQSLVKRIIRWTPPNHIYYEMYQFNPQGGMRDHIRLFIDSSLEQLRESVEISKDYTGEFNPHLMEKGEFSLDQLSDILAFIISLNESLRTAPFFMYNISFVIGCKHFYSGAPRLIYAVEALE